VIIIFGINRSGVFGGGIEYTEMKINRNFSAFTDLKSLELEVPMICLATGCVLLRRDRRYNCSKTGCICKRNYLTKYRNYLHGLFYDD
jgi:hypothetical protein